MVAPRSRPDVLCVVLDCARAATLNATEPSKDRFLNWARLLRESVLFDHAVAPSSWTLPSHASMFTGKYPWEHGLLHGGTTTLTGTLPTMARDLRELGYTTASFSANPLIGSSTGLAAGFDVALSGRFLDCYLRPLSGRLTGPSSGVPTERSPLLKRLEAESGLTIRAALKKVALFQPLAFDLLLRSAARVRGGDHVLRSDVAPWIEIAMREWLGSVDQSRPCFGFVNLLDAHEPYLCLPEEIASWREWFAAMKVRQDSLQQFFGTRMPSATDLEVLHRLYLESLGVADRRLGAILELFAHYRDLDNTIVIVTSDHGQAFGEGGQVYHGRGTTDEIVRVPLAVRFPQSLGYRGITHRWFSTAALREKIVQPILSNTSLPGDLDDLATRPGGDAYDPVYAISDNYESPVQFEGHAAAAPFSGSLVGFRDSTKLELSLPDRRIKAFDESRSVATEVPLEEKDPTMRFLLDRLTSIAATQLPEIRYTRADSWTHLAAWGYES